jgi:transcription elongation factor GreB
MSQTNYMTPRGFEIIRRELDWIESVERPKIVAEVSWAASLGDRSENAEYIYGKKRLRALDGRRAFLVKRLRKGQVVDPLSISGDVVRFGATVVLEDDEGNARTWRIYGEDEVDIENGILSWRSPVARALLGKSEGDEAVVVAPAGTRSVAIVEVRYEPCPEIPDDLNFGR